MSALLSSLHAFRHMTSGLESWRVEVEALAQLRHPNIIAILGAVIEPPTYACVLEYCDGHDLSTALQGDTPPGFVLRVAKGVASGVEYVHSQQLIHRDIKGSNILLEASGKRRGRVWKERSVPALQMGSLNISLVLPLMRQSFEGARTLLTSHTCNATHPAVSSSYTIPYDLYVSKVVSSSAISASRRTHQETRVQPP